MGEGGAEAETVGTNRVIKEADIIGTPVVAGNQGEEHTAAQVEESLLEEEEEEEGEEEEEEVAVIEILREVANPGGKMMNQKRKATIMNKITILIKPILEMHGIQAHNQ